MGDWDKQASDSELQKNAKTITDTLAVLANYQELASKGIANGATSLAQAQETIENALASIKSQTALRQTLAKELTDANQQNSNVADLGQKISTLTPQVEQQKTLYQLRTEQAAALAEKYAGNSYSSWWQLWFPLGLSKPLPATTRVLVYASAVALLGVAFFASGRPKAAQTFPQAGGRRKNRSPV